MPLMPALLLKKVEFFVPGQLANLLNARLHWRTEAEYKRTWRKNVWASARAATSFRAFPPEEPKAVTLTAYTWNLMDSHDGLRAALKPVVDGLVDSGLIHSDAPRSGHDFLYVQAIRRRKRGVLITIEPLAPRPAAGEEGKG